VTGADLTDAERGPDSTPQGRLDAKIARESLPTIRGGPLPVALADPPGVCTSVPSGQRLVDPAGQGVRRDHAAIASAAGSACLERSALNRRGPILTGDDHAAKQEDSAVENAVVAMRRTVSEQPHAQEAV